MSNSDRPTRVRHGVIAAASLMSVLLYLDRICISFAEQYIQEDLSLSDAQVGWMLSAFFVTYALGQVPAGWLTDRFGSRIMLTIYVLLWSLFTGLTGGASAFAALLVLRLGFGFSQAGAYPTASSIISKWVPIHRRGTASGFIALGGRVGGFLALFASGHMIVWLTPSDIETALKPSDLLNAPLLCFELSETPEPEASYAGTSETGTRGSGTSDAETPVTESPTSRLRRKCFERFAADHREVVKRQGAEYAAALSHQQRKKTGEEGDTVAAALPPADTSMLVDELNALIRSRGFFVPEDIKDVSVEGEAVRLMRRSATDLTDQQAARLNRLVLEGLFPDGVKKLYVAGWRPMMVVYGSLGIIVAALIWWSCHTTPVEHPQANAAEAALIQGDRPGGQTAHSNVAGVPWGPLVRSRSMWSSCLSQWFTNIGWVFLITWAPRYLANVHHVPTEQRALLVSIPPLIGWIGMLSGGAMTDLAIRKVGLRWGRVLPISLSRWVAMFAYLGCLFEPNALLAVALFSIVAFATDFGTPSSWAFTQDVGGCYVGSVLGWGNMWGNLGAAITPPLLIWIVGETQNWNNAFLTCAGAFLLAGLCSLGINATIPIVPDDADAPDEPSKGAGGEGVAD